MNDDSTESTDPPLVYVLGPIATRRDSDRVEVPPRLARLLAALVLADGGIVPNDRLVDAVWGATPPSGADSSLKTYIARLRRYLAPAAQLRFRAPGYALELAPRGLDRDRFEDLLAGARLQLRVSDVDAARASLDEALDSWRGEPFGGLADEDWARPECVRLAELHTSARVLDVEIAIAEARLDDAIGSARRLTREEPLREQPWRLLMLALYKTGRQAEALREYRQYGVRLAETGLEPSSQLAELESDIATGRLDARPERRIGGYLIGDQIGTGTFSTVHRAFQPALDREVAIKVVRSELADRAEFVRRFEVEARTVARLEHPHIVPLYDFWREPGAAFLAMRLMQGGSAEQALRERGPFSRRATAQLVREIGGALGTAHRAGVAHSDVRPANLLFDEHGSAYLADFGIATPFPADGRTGFSDAAYAAPELLRGAAAAAPSDVLSLGVTAFELLSGRLPFADAAGRQELIRRQLDDPLPPLSATRRDLPAAVDVVLARATAKAPGDRYQNVQDFVDDLTDALGFADESERSRVSAQATALDVPNPYVGLHAFDEVDADHFFGRERLIAELTAAVEEHRMVTVVGPSGSGKSSVVRAGLVPAVRRGAVPGSEHWFVTSMVPGSDPISAFESALLRVAVNPPTSLHEQLHEDGGLLRAVRRVVPDDVSTVFLVIDQFEELFVHTVDEDLRRRFLDELASAITAPRSPLRVVATLRADHFDGPLRHPGFAALLDDATVPVTPLAPSDVERVIVAPAEAAGVEVEAALVAELVAAMTDRAASLPLLQFTLAELYERRMGGALSAAGLRELGGMAGVLANRAEQIVHPPTESSIDAVSAVDTEVARRIFGRLVAFDASGRAARRRAPRSEFADEKSVWMIDAFVRARLLATDRDERTREPTVEVAHEALLYEWPLLQSWLDADRADLVILQSVSSAAREWEEAGRDPADLLRASRLEAAVEALERHGDWFTPAEVEFVDVGVEARDKAAVAEAHQRRRLRRSLVAVAVMLVVAAVGAAIALVQRDRAVSSEADADVARLVAQSAAQRDENRELSILLALEAYRRRPDAASSTAVHRAIGPEPSLVAIHPPAIKDASRVELSADATTAVVAGSPSDPRVQIVDLVTGEWVGDPVDLGSGVIGLNVSGDGARVAVISQDLELVLVERGGSRNTIDTEADTDRVEMNTDGSRVAWFLPERGVVRVWHGDSEPASAVDELDLIGELGQIDYFESLAISPSGEFLALLVGRFDPTNAEDWNTTILYSTEDRRIVSVFDPRVGFGSAIAVTDAGRVAVTIEDHVVVWDGPDDDEPLVLRGHFGPVTGVAFSSEGAVVTTGADGLLRQWNSAGEVAGAPLGVDGGVDTLSVGADGTISVARGDGVVVTMATDPLSRLSRRIEVESFAAVDPALDFVEVALDGFTGYRMIDFDTEEVVATVDLSVVMPGGLDSPGFWSRDGSHVAVWGRASLDGGPLSAVTVVGAKGENPAVHAVADLTRQLGLDEGVPGGGVAIRTANDGRRFFFIHPAVPGFLAGWFDTATGQLVAGPLAVDSAGEPFLLGDGRVLIGSAEGELQMFGADLQTSTTIENGAGFKPLDVTPDDGRALVGAGDGRIALLDLDALTLTPVASVGDHAFKGSLSPDGRRAAIALLNTGIQLVDVEDRSLLGVPLLSGVRASGFPKVRWADDGETLWFAAEHAVLQLEAEPDAWFARACSIVGRTMTSEQWHRYVEPDTSPIDACALRDL